MRCHALCDPPDGDTAIPAIGDCDITVHSEDDQACTPGPPASTGHGDVLGVQLSQSPRLPAAQIDVSDWSRGGGRAEDGEGVVRVIWGVHLPVRDEKEVLIWHQENGRHGIVVCTLAVALGRQDLVRKSGDRRGE